MNRSLVAALLVALPAQALAWEHTLWMWDSEQFPVPYVISDYQEDSVPAGFGEEAVNAAMATWENDAACAFLQADYQGLTPINDGFDKNDDMNRFSWDDPTDDHDAGVLGVTLCYTYNSTFKVQDGRTYEESYDCDIIYNDNVNWATDEDIGEGDCNGESSLIAVSTHEIGHWWGMGHSCEDPGKGGGPCYDPLLLEATMYWTADACDLAQSSLNEDDLEGINALYGPYASVECSNEIDPNDPNTIAFGIVPFDLKCEVVSDQMDEIDVATWRWGDGAESEGFDALHTYETPGNYTLQTEIVGTNEECGEWQYTARKLSYVRACGVPEAEFTVAHEDGLTYNLLNETDISVYGCIYTVQWDIFDSSGGLVTSLQAWEPQYTFEEEGTYRVVLNLGGPAGTGAAELQVEVKNRRGEGYGCNTAAGVGGGFGMLVGLASLLSRRRR